MCFTVLRTSEPTGINKNRLPHENWRAGYEKLSFFTRRLVTSGRGCHGLTFYLMTTKARMNIDLSPVALVSLVILKKTRHILVVKRSGFFYS